MHKLVLKVGLVLFFRRLKELQDSDGIVTFNDKVKFPTVIHVAY